MKVNYVYDGQETHKRIAMLAEARKETLSEVERACVIGHGSISRWKAGRVPSASAVAKLAQHFDVTVDYLLAVTTSNQRSYNLDKIMSMTGSVKLGDTVLNETQLTMLKQIAITIIDTT